MFTIVPNIETHMHFPLFLNKLLFDGECFAVEKLLLIVEEDPEDFWFEMPFGVKSPGRSDWEVDFDDSLGNWFEDVINFHFRDHFTESFELF